MRFVDMAFRSSQGQIHPPVELSDLSSFWVPLHRSRPSGPRPGRASAAALPPFPHGGSQRYGSIAARAKEIDRAGWHGASRRLAATRQQHRLLQLTPNDRIWHPQWHRLPRNQRKCCASRSDYRSPMKSCRARPPGAASRRKSRSYACVAADLSARAVP